MDPKNPTRRQALSVAAVAGGGILLGAGARLPGLRSADVSAAEAASSCLLTLVYATRDEL